MPYIIGETFLSFTTTGADYRISLPDTGVYRCSANFGDTPNKNNFSDIIFPKENNNRILDSAPDGMVAAGKVFLYRIVPIA
ncbi:MAG: hypothetical protein LBK25_04730 [Treponema sp.]|jgi:hypothetical protein|nr:hypothetical protein [Treponema sp.]